MGRLEEPIGGNWITRSVIRNYITKGKIRKLDVAARFTLCSAKAVSCGCTLKTEKVDVIMDIY